MFKSKNQKQEFSIDLIQEELDAIKYIDYPKEENCENLLKDSLSIKVNKILKKQIPNLKNIFSKIEKDNLQENFDVSTSGSYNISDNKKANFNFENLKNLDVSEEDAFRKTACFVATSPCRKGSITTRESNFKNEEISKNEKNSKNKIQTQNTFSNIKLISPRYDNSPISNLRELNKTSIYNY